MDAKEKAFRMAYERYIGKDHVVDLLLGHLENISSCLDFFETLRVNLGMVRLNSEGVKALLDLPLDGSLSEQERAYKVVMMPTMRSVYPELSIYSSYWDEFLKLSPASVYFYLMGEENEHFKDDLIDSLEKHPAFCSWMGGDLRKDYADDIFHLTGAARDMFLEGVEVSVNTLREICV